MHKVWESVKKSDDDNQYHRMNKKTGTRTNTHTVTHTTHNCEGENGTHEVNYSCFQLSQNISCGVFLGWVGGGNHHFPTHVSLTHY